MTLDPTDEEVYFIVASMPETFTDDNQTFSHEINIDKGLGIAGKLRKNSLPFG